MTQEEVNVDEAQISRVLHFVIYNGYKEKCRPAIVVEDWPEQGRPGYVNLVVFTDGTNDGPYGEDEHKHNISEPGKGLTTTKTGPFYQLVRWETSVLPNHAVKVVRSWHWPRECSKLHAPAAPFIKEDKNPNTGLEEYTKVHHNHDNSVVDFHNCYACMLKQGTGMPL